MNALNLIALLIPSIYLLWPIFCYYCIGSLGKTCSDHALMSYIILYDSLIEIGYQLTGRKRLFSHW